MCAILNGFQVRAISLNNSIFVDKEILFSASNADICCSSGKAATAYIV
jgi:hypothetical protein